jgi:glycosyltransferase involved in cell wall biosynthesis
VGGKGLELAVEAANYLQIPLKVVGKSAGWGAAGKRLRNMAGKKVEFLGDVADNELWGLYAGAKALLATAKDEDFGITPVEAMACGTPVIAYYGGGYMETVVEGKTGWFFTDYSIEGLVNAIKRFSSVTDISNKKNIRKQAEKYAKKRFKEEINKFIISCIKA